MPGRLERQKAVMLQGADDRLVHPHAVLVQPQAARGQWPAAGNANVVPTVTIGGVNAVVQYAGVAPGFVGLYQVNAVVPAGVAPNSAVQVVLTQKSVTSNTATIAVK